MKHFKIISVVLSLLFLLSGCSATQNVVTSIASVKQQAIEDYCAATTPEKQLLLRAIIARYTTDENGNRVAFTVNCNTKSLQIAVK